MSRINDSAISFAERRTFRAFIGLYGLMSFSILVLIGMIYYQNQKERMLSEHRLAMQLESEHYIPQLRAWMSQDLSIKRPFPIDLAYNTAFYDALGMKVEGYLEDTAFTPKKVIALQKGYIHFYVSLAAYEIGDFYVVFETKDDGLWLKNTLVNLLQYGGLVLVFLIVIGFYLGRLIFAPMRESITLLDHFIKDTTHELNTPLQTIAANIEMIDTEQLASGEIKKFERVKIAAQTIAMIYDDLTYLTLHHRVAIHDETLQMCALLHERLEFFKARCDQKRLHVTLECKEVSLFMDKGRAIRLIDNLISNAIKYNRVGGRIEVYADETSLHVKDNGVGIDPKKVETIFKRYVRHSDHEGGFGIGLHIVAKIAQHYGFGIDVHSSPNEGTSVSVTWSSTLSH